MAYILLMAYIVMAYIVMAYIVMAYVVMVYIVMAYIVMALHSHGAIAPRPAATNQGHTHARSHLCMHVRCPEDPCLVKVQK